MHAEGRIEGGYRCKNSVNGGCWNKATALRKTVHEQISTEIRKRLLGSEDILRVIVRRLADVISNEESSRQRIDAAAKTVADLRQVCEHLLSAIEGRNALPGAASTPSTLTERLLRREEELAIAEAELGRLSTSAHEPPKLLTDPELRELLNTTAEKLVDLNREAGVLLRQLVPRIEAVPYRQFGSDKIVLRASFDLQLGNILPSLLRFHRYLTI